MAKRWQGVDAAPRMLPYLTVANSVVAVIGAYRYHQQPVQTPL